MHLPMHHGYLLRLMNQSCWSKNRLAHIHKAEMNKGTTGLNPNGWSPVMTHVFTVSFIHSQPTHKRRIPNQVTLGGEQKISACDCSQLGAICVENCWLECFLDSLSRCRFRNEAQNLVEEVKLCKVLLFINWARHKNCQVRCARYVVEYCYALLGDVVMGHIRPCRSVIKNRNRPLTVIMTVLRGFILMVLDTIKEL
jgi:hypothetical protein